MELAIAWIVANWATILQVSTGIVGVFAMIASLTENESDNKVADKLLKIVNFLGANFGKAKNDDRA